LVPRALRRNVVAEINVSFVDAARIRNHAHGIAGLPSFLPFQTSLYTTPAISVFWR
jgi:hypothetical protein